MKKSNYAYHPDGYLVWTNSRYKDKIGTRAGRYHAPSGYERVTWGKGQRTVHRVVWYLHHGYWPETIDHINGDKRDNRIENLREVTDQQNTWNRQLRKNNVTYMPKRPSQKKWRASVVKDGKNHLSYHLTEAEAQARAEEMRLELFGEYARAYANSFDF